MTEGQSANGYLFYLLPGIGNVTCIAAKVQELNILNTFLH